MREIDTVNLIKKSKLFQNLDDYQVENLCRVISLSEKCFSRNQVIITQGEPVGQIGVIKRGTVISTKYHFDGNQQILRIYNQGEVFSLDAVNTTSSKSPVTFISQTESRVVFLPYTQIFSNEGIAADTKKTIMENSSEILSNELIRLMYKIDVLSKRTLQERILTYLSLIREKSDGDTFDIGMNQGQFAQYLCVNRSVLSNELNRMRASGLIDYKGKRFTLHQGVQK